MLPRATSRAVYSFVTQSPDTQDIAISLVLEQPTVKAPLSFVIGIVIRGQTYCQT